MTIYIPTLLQQQTNHLIDQIRSILFLAQISSIFVIILSREFTNPTHRRWIFALLVLSSSILFGSISLLVLKQNQESAHFNLLLVIIMSIATGSINFSLVRKVKHWFNSKNLRGSKATFVASSVGMMIPVLMLLFGNSLIPAELTFWVAVISACIAIGVAYRQKDT